MKKLVALAILIGLGLTGLTSCTNEEVIGAGLITTGVLVAASNPSPSYHSRPARRPPRPHRRGY
jgi:hypothetical protein